MIVVPALDILGGRVVHATGGERANYVPVSRLFSLPSDPVALSRQLRERWGRRLLYVADLDALEERTPQFEVIERLAAGDHRLRVDAGVRGRTGARALRRAGADEIVVALEAMGSWSQLEEVSAEVGATRTVFSLDVRGGRPVCSRDGAAGSPELVARRAVEGGASRILVLDLDRVGSRRGPPLSLLRRCRSAVPDAGLSVGGGARGAADVEACAGAGADECVAATALYDGSLPPEDIDRIEGGIGGRRERPDPGADGPEDQSVDSSAP